MKKLIKQQHYGNLLVNGKEKDIVEVWMEQKHDPQLIQIELENIPALIDCLKKLMPNTVCECGYKSGRECLADCRKDLTK